MKQLPLLLPDRPPDPQMAARIRDAILRAMQAPTQPSPHELIENVHAEVGAVAHWDIVPTLRLMAVDSDLQRAYRKYFKWIIDAEDLLPALLGMEPPRHSVESSLDELIHRSKHYRSSLAFQDMVSFMARFKDYAPYNNMLVRLQNPGCSFFATARDWKNRFGRCIIEDARPMLILAPMRPLICVYDIDQTEGRAVPAELAEFSKFEGNVGPETWELLVNNAARHDRIRVDVKPLSGTLSGFATFARGTDAWKMRIAIHEGLDLSSRIGVLCHELAHIYLGHLGTDAEHWWPARANLDLHSVEIEAESTAHLVTARLGLSGTSHTYVSRHLTEGDIPAGVSVDLIAKVAGRIEQMSKRTLAERQPKEGRK